MTTWKVEIPHRPPTPKRNGQASSALRASEFAKHLRAKMAQFPGKAQSPVRARIWLYLRDDRAQPDGDLDNYAKCILDLLKKPNAENAAGGVLHDDRDIEDLRISRHRTHNPMRVRTVIKLTW